MAQNPFDKFKTGFGLNLPTATTPNNTYHGGNQDVFNAGQTTTKAESSTERRAPTPVNVNFPPHLYIPEGAQSLDLRRVINAPAGTVRYELFSFTAPPGAATRFIGYGIFNDGDAGVNYNFQPLVDGNRIFPYHGDPSDNYKIYLGLAPDLSASSIIPCQLMIAPGQVLTWLVTNTSSVDTSMGVRMIGYFDTSQERTTGRFGG